jgi:hypothetical protein
MKKSKQFGEAGLAVDSCMYIYDVHRKIERNETQFLFCGEQAPELPIWEALIGIPSS